MVLIMSPEMVHMSLQEHHRVVLIKRSFETRRRIIAICIIGLIVFPLIFVVADLYNFFFPKFFNIFLFSWLHLWIQILTPVFISPVFCFFKIESLLNIEVAMVVKTWIFPAYSSAFVFVRQDIGQKTVDIFRHFRWQRWWVSRPSGGGPSVSGAGQQECRGTGPDPGAGEGKGAGTRGRPWKDWDRAGGKSIRGTRLGKSRRDNLFLKQQQDARPYQEVHWARSR